MSAVRSKLMSALLLGIGLVTLAISGCGSSDEPSAQRSSAAPVPAQSMYFAALCRAVGIPARTTGGFQLFTGVPAGHFWAELYLPNYGWLPVDPAAAEIVDYLPEVSAADKRAFHDFFFGNQDDLRLTVQKDVDLPLIPRANGRVALPMAIQMPATLCDTMTDVPTLVLGQYWSFK